MNFDKIIEKVLEHEGGYVNDPNDLGGETNYGITKRFYPDVDIKNLTREQAKDIYKRDYWDKNRVESLPENLWHIFFDMCVNMGRGTAVKILQRAANGKGRGIDVGCERQVQIKGPDAEALSQFLTPRNIKKCSKGQAMYAPFLDFKGGFINDPVMLKIDEDCFWFSLADGDALLWTQGIAAGYKFDVDIHEPDVSPLQVQGPNSKELMVKVFGEWVNDLGFYRFKEINHKMHPCFFGSVFLDLFWGFSRPWSRKTRKN